MMELHFKMAQPYANAVFNLAVKDKVASWLTLLNALSDFITTDKAALEMLKNPLADHIAWIDDIEKPLALSLAQKTFLQLVAKRKALYLLPAIAVLFGRLVAEQENQLLVTVESAVELTALEQNQLLISLNKKFSQAVVFDFEINPKLMGGIRLSSAPFVVDASVKRRVELISHQLLS